jgi:hypothetical protein
MDLLLILLVSMICVKNLCLPPNDQGCYGPYLGISIVLGGTTGQITEPEAVCYDQN